MLDNVMSVRRGLEDQRYVVKPYYGFLLQNVIRVLEPWYNKQERIALDNFVILCSIVPKEVYQILKNDIEEVRKAREQALKVYSIGYFAQSRESNRNLKAVAFNKMWPLMRRLVSELEKRGYIEKEVLSGYRRDPKRITQDMFKR